MMLVFSSQRKYSSFWPRTQVQDKLQDKRIERVAHLLIKHRFFTNVNTICLFCIFCFKLKKDSLIINVYDMIY